MAPKSQKKKFSRSKQGSTSRYAKQQQPIREFTYEQICQMTTESKENFVGEGKCGKVYRGVLELDDDGYNMDIKDVAVKVIPVERKDYAENELKAYTDLSSHQNIVPLVGTCFTTEKLIFVMNFVPRTLEKVLETKEGGIVGYELNWARTLGILKQLANGIKALIAEDYVSGDIKPDNVLVDEEYNVFLCDFGSAKKGGRNLPTVNGEYGPIEVKESGQGDSKKSDIYSYGVILLQVIMKENHFACLDRASSLNEQVDFYKKILKGGTSRRDSNSSKSQKLEPHVSILARVAKERQGHAVHKTLLQSGCSTSDAEKLTVLGIACTEEKVNSRPLIETVIATLGEFNV